MLQTEKDFKSFCEQFIVFIVYNFLYDILKKRAIIDTKKITFSLPSRGRSCSMFMYVGLSPSLYVCLNVSLCQLRLNIFSIFLYVSIFMFYMTFIDIPGFKVHYKEHCEYEEREHCRTHYNEVRKHL